MEAVREIITKQQAASVACFSVDKPEFDHAYHYHPEIEITWILESDGQRMVGDSLEAFAPGDLLLLGGGLPHRYTNWERKRARALVIQFMPDFLGAGFFDLVESYQIKDLFQRANRGLRFSESTRRQAVELIDGFYQHYPDIIGLTRLIELLAVLSADEEAQAVAGLGYAETLNHQTVKRLQRVLAYIDIHWAEKISLESVSKVAALHPQSLSRFMRQHLGMNFQNYLTHLRLERAARQLLESKQTITEIAYASGFENLSNFNRQFKRRYHCPPRSFRRQRA